MWPKWTHKRPLSFLWSWQGSLQDLSSEVFNCALKAISVIVFDSYFWITQQEFLIFRWQEWDGYSHSGQRFKNTSQMMCFDIPLHGIPSTCQRNSCMCPYENKHVRMFFTALFWVPGSWRQHRYPPFGEWIDEWDRSLWWISCSKQNNAQTVL